MDNVIDVWTVSGGIGEPDTGLTDSDLEENYTVVYTIDDDTERPFLETAFQDYTVTEGILLMLLLSVWFYAVFSLVRNGFRWLKK